MNYFLRNWIDWYFYFVIAIFFWIIKFCHDLAALFVPSINEVSAATLPSTSEWAGAGWAPTGQAANLERF